MTGFGEWFVFAFPWLVILFFSLRIAGAPGRLSASGFPGTYNSWSGLDENWDSINIGSAALIFFFMIPLAALEAFGFTRWHLIWVAVLMLPTESLLRIIRKSETGSSGGDNKKTLSILIAGAALLAVIIESVSISVFHIWGASVSGSTASGMSRVLALPSVGLLSGLIAGLLNWQVYWEHRLNSIALMGRKLDIHDRKTSRAMTWAYNLYLLLLLTLLPWLLGELLGHSSGIGIIVAFLWFSVAYLSYTLTKIPVEPAAYHGRTWF
jgi:hypothetical protein